MVQWDGYDKRCKELIKRRCKTLSEFKEWVAYVHDNGQSIESIKFIQSSYSEIAANGTQVLITVANSLLSRQLATLAEAFENEGGFTEKLYRVRKAKNRSY